MSTAALPANVATHTIDYRGSHWHQGAVYEATLIYAIPLRGRDHYGRQAYHSGLGPKGSRVLVRQTAVTYPDSPESNWDHVRVFAPSGRDFADLEPERVKLHVAIKRDGQGRPVRASPEDVARMLDRHHWELSR